ncbi:hypothetical protein SUBVAR_06815 [Subdoligranulum variabile DSM 15176]|uniref:Uncharacterized protein n=1 Tax=Subdoligranulum variabile DSM 15176 TaxID=411471 RepID=D1PQY8_9FIRM|nr:hypothetical protein SUBVAR_06815 [Subdoligranulum variabile DSM 15176]
MLFCGSEDSIPDFPPAYRDKITGARQRKRPPLPGTGKRGLAVLGYAR